MSKRKSTEEDQVSMKIPIYRVMEEQLFEADSNHPEYYRNTHLSCYLFRNKIKAINFAYDIARKYDEKYEYADDGEYCTFVPGEYDNKYHCYVELDEIDLGKDIIATVEF